MSVNSYEEYITPIVAMIEVHGEGILCSSLSENELLEEYEGEW
jgi:hypothetical protein